MDSSTYGLVLNMQKYFFNEKGHLCFDTRMINSNFLFDKNRNLTVHLTTYKFVYLTGQLTTCKCVSLGN